MVGVPIRNDSSPVIGLGRIVGRGVPTSVQRILAGKCLSARGTIWRSVVVRYGVFFARVFRVSFLLKSEFGDKVLIVLGKSWITVPKLNPPKIRDRPLQS